MTAHPNFNTFKGVFYRLSSCWFSPQPVNPSLSSILLLGCKTGTLWAPLWVSAGSFYTSGHVISAPDLHKDSQCPSNQRQTAVCNCLLCLSVMFSHKQIIMCVGCKHIKFGFVWPTIVDWCRDFVEVSESGRGG